MRFSDARLHAELSRCMYSEHGLDALMRPVAGTGVPFVDRGVVLHAGVGALPRGLRDLAHQLAGADGVDRLPVNTALSFQSWSCSKARMNSSVTRTELFAF